MLIGGHVINAFSRTQAVVALSSAEAELCALVLAASEALGVKAMAADYGVDLGAWMWGRRKRSDRDRPSQGPRKRALH